MQDPSTRPATNSRALNAAMLINMAVGSNNTRWRAQYLADAQRQLGHALRSVIQEAVDDGLTWAEIGESVQLPRETAFRQFDARGPIAVMRATHTQKEETPQMEALYAFENEDGIWFGEPDALSPGEYFSASFSFNPANPDNRFGGQILRVRCGPRPAQEVSVHAPQVRLADDSERRVRATEEVIGLLFDETGQFQLRRALTACYYAIVGNKAVDQQLEYVVNKASDAMKLNVPIEQFLDSAYEVLEVGGNTKKLDEPAHAALRQLNRAVQDHIALQATAR